MDAQQWKLFQAGKFDELIAELQKNVLACDTDAKFDLAGMLDHVGRLDEAIHLYERMEKEFAPNAILQSNFGTCLYRANRKSDALQHLLSALDLARREPGNEQTLSVTHNTLGVLYKNEYQFEKAVCEFRYAIALTGNYMAVENLENLKELGSESCPVIRGCLEDDGTTRICTWRYCDNDFEYLSQEILIPCAFETSNYNPSDGQLIEAVMVPWFEIISQIEKDKDFLFKVPWRVLEELIAGAYQRDGWSEVILTPRSGDGGRDIIASKSGVGCIRIFDQVKAFAATHKVTANDVRALLGVLTVRPNVSKGIVTTTSSFAPGIFREFSNLLPYRIELRDGKSLRQWLVESANKQRRNDIITSGCLKDLERKTEKTGLR